MLALAVHYGAAARPPCQVASQAAPPGWGRSWAGLSRRAVSQVQRPGMNWSGDVLEPGLHPGQGLLGPHPAPGGGAGPMHCMTAGKAINVNTCHTHWALTSHHRHTSTIPVRQSLLKSKHICSYKFSDPPPPVPLISRVIPVIEWEEPLACISQTVDIEKLQGGHKERKEV